MRVLVNSPRQLWSVAGYLSMVIEGVFGVEADGSVAPKLPARLVPLLFGERDRIVLRMDGRRWTLLRPARDVGDLLVAGRLDRRGDETIVHLVGARSRNAAPPPLAEAHFAPETPAEPRLQADGADWRVQVPADATLYLDGRPYRGDAAALRLPRLLHLAPGFLRCRAVCRWTTATTSHCCKARWKCSPRWCMPWTRRSTASSLKPTSST